MAVTLSIWGVYQWDKTIFDDLVCPEELCSKEDLIEEIIYQAAELELLYSPPQLLKSAISRWSKRRLPIWTHLYETTQYEYNPIDNYNRIEEWEDKSQKDNTLNDTLNTTGENNTQSHSNTNVLGKVAGYNGPTDSENDMVNRESSDSSDTSSATTSINGTNQRNSEENELLSAQHKGTIKGNIGVTTTQAMITQEREIAQFDVFQYIVDDFINYFCVGVY